MILKNIINEEELDNHIHKRLLEMGAGLFLQAWYTGNLCWDWCGDLKILSLPIMRL